jgi:lysyl-tRNA synthetase class II
MELLESCIPPLSKLACVIKLECQAAMAQASIADDEPPEMRERYGDSQLVQVRSRPGLLRFRLHLICSNDDVLLATHVWPCIDFELIGNPLVQSTAVTGRVWTPVTELNKGLAGQTVLVRGRVHNVRGKGKSAFVVLRSEASTVQCVLFVGETVSKGMVKWVSSLPKESIVDVEGTVAAVEQPITSTTQKDVEISVSRIHCISRSLPQLPFQIEDAARSEAAIDAALAEQVRIQRPMRFSFRCFSKSDISSIVFIPGNFTSYCFFLFLGNTARTCYVFRIQSSAEKIA